MITIKTNKKTVDEFADLLLTSKGKYVSVRKRIDGWLAAHVGHADEDIFKYLQKDLKKIIISKPVALESIINDFKVKGYQARILDSKGKLNLIGEELKDCFRYKNFRASKKAHWLSAQLNIKSCVYCNTQYSLTVKQKSGTKMLFHLDHFFSKELYPYLSLSFYNLIPCCASCNMGKSDKSFKLSESIHPYIESLDEIAKYGTEPASLVKFLLDINKNENEIKLLLEIRNQHLGDKKLQKKLDNYKEDFNIEDQYAQFKDVVAETYLKSLYYNKYRREELIKFFKKKHKQVLSDDMIKRFVVGNYTDSKDLLKRPLAKMTKDISEDFFTHF
ncbi:hypothetical protein [uncultured Maribacter sp.]|uniref:hypothetical protein n=1 Tax=uncultured Maribacter sp. TaxID=431308 RepID=UPI00262FB24D|nr:hypothetical protein [uncultured Maribacter sp.]